MQRSVLVAAVLSAWSFGACAADLPQATIVAPEAPGGISGDAMAYAGGLSLTDFSTDYAQDLTGNLAGVAGRVNIPLTPAIAAQFDVSGEHLTDNLGADYSTFDGAAHLAWRSDEFLLGVFGSLGNTNNLNMDGNFGTLGVEGQVDLGQLVLSAQAGETRSISTADPEYNVTAPYIRGEIRYFLTPNLAVAANVGAAQETYDEPDNPIDATTWGGDVEYRFDNSPISVFASYQGSYEAETGEGESWVKHAVLAGVKFNFGSPTLQEAAKSGATLRDYNPITGVQAVRYNNWE